MPRSSSICRLSLALLVLVGMGSVAWAKPKVAILGLEVSNSGAVDPKDAVNASKLTEELRRFVQGGATKYELSPAGNRELQDEKLMGNCDTEKPSCMAPIGAGMQAEFLVYGRIEKQRDGYKVSIKILNVKQRLIEETWEGPVKTAEIGTPALKDWAQRVHAKLTGEKLPAVAPPDRAPEKLPAKLVVRVGNTPGGEVFVNGARRGLLEGGALTLSLPEGTHLLAIEAADRKRYEETVTVTSGQTKTVSVELERVVMAAPPAAEEPSGGRSGRLGLKVAGFAALGLAAGAGGYATYLTFAGPIKKYEDGEAPAIRPGSPEAGTTIDSKDCDRRRAIGVAVVDNDAGYERFKDACRANRQRLVLGVVGGVLAASAVTTLYFAYRDSRPSKERRAANGRKRREFQVTPVVSPSGGGATVRFDW